MPKQGSWQMKNPYQKSAAACAGLLAPTETVRPSECASRPSPPAVTLSIRAARICHTRPEAKEHRRPTTILKGMKEHAFGSGWGVVTETFRLS
jgi:hypothetical protein